MTESQSIKVKEAQELIHKRINKLDEEVNAFFDNLFTDDIKKMVCEYTGVSYGYTYRDLGNGYRVDFCNVWIMYNRQKQLQKDILKHYDWSCETINDISYCVKNIKSIEENLAFYSERTEEIINIITNGYKCKVESDDEKINKALEILGGDTEPIKKCKITVEWIN